MKGKLEATLAGGTEDLGATAVLSRRAKVLMMVQALLSLLIIAVLVSRAINTLAAA
jgi:hypothetical protein